MALSAGMTTAHAQDVGDIVVLGTAIEESIPVDLASYGNRLEVVSGDTIRQGGYVDVSQALQMLVPGLYMTPKNGAFDYVEASLQGSRNSDILYLVDGVRISNRLYNTTSPLDTIPAHAIERVEVLKGGQGIFYGTQSLAGVINVVTRSFSKESDFQVGVMGGPHSTYGVDGYWRDTLGETSVVVFASQDKSRGTRAFRSEDYQPSGTDRERSYDVTNAGLKIGRPFAERFSVALEFLHTGAKLDFAQPNAIASAFNERNENIVSAKFNANLSDSFCFYLKAYYHRWVSHYSEFDNVLPVDGTTEAISDREFWGFKDRGLNLMTRWRMSPAAELLAGADLQRYDGSDAVLLIAPRTEQVRVGFLQLRTNEQTLPDTQLAAGLRYNDVGSGKTATVWNVSGRHNFGAGWYLRATAGTSFRLPDAYELYAIDPFDTNGNPLLKPERGKGGDVGLGSVWSRDAFKATWEVMYFSRRVSDLIDFVDDGTPNGTWGNTSTEVRMSGAELTGRVTYGDWSLGFDHTASRARLAGSSEQLFRQPRQQSKASLVWQNQATGLSGAIDATHVGTISQNVSGVGVQHYGNYTVADASLLWQFGASRRQGLGVRVINVFDTEYASRLSRATNDVTGESYAVWNVGTPRTWQLRYSYGSPAIR